MAPLIQQEVAAAAQDFLQRVAQIFAEAGRQVMAGDCSTAADLVALEAALRASLNEWTHKEPSLGTQHSPNPLFFSLHMYTTGIWGLKCNRDNTLRPDAHTIEAKTKLVHPQWCTFECSPQLFLMVVL